jgi:hypothetical protein
MGEVVELGSKVKKFIYCMLQVIESSSLNQLVVEAEFGNYQVNENISPTLNEEWEVEIRF